MQSQNNHLLTIDLFDNLIEINQKQTWIQLANNAFIMRGYAATIAHDLLKELDAILRQAVGH